MSQQTLQDLLGKIKDEYQQVYEDARDGKTPNSAWDVDLPVDREYRVKVVEAEYKASKQSGREQFVFTYEVVEPAEYAGAKFQDYQSPNPTTTIGIEMFAKMVGAFGVSLEGHASDEAFAKAFEDRVVVVALRKWGQEMDRTGIRWFNKDKGQTLSTSVKPKGAPRASAANLRPDINIPKDDAPATPPVTPPVTPPTVQSPVPGGVNLPPGLRQS